MSGVQPGVPKGKRCGRCEGYHPTGMVAGVGHCMNVFRANWKMIVTDDEVCDCWTPKDWGALLDYMIVEATGQELSELEETLTTRKDTVASLLEFLVEKGTAQQRAWFENVHI